MSISLNDEFKVNRSIKVGFNLIASRNQNPYDVTGSGTDVLNNARKVMPQVSAQTKSFRVPNPYNNTDTTNANLYSTTDAALQNSGVQNPLIQLQNEWNKDIDFTNFYNGNVYAEINFLKHFTFRSSFYANLTYQDQRIYKPLYNAYDPVNNIAVLQSQVTSVTQNTNSNKVYQQDQILTYMNTFGNSNLTVTGGFTSYYNGVFNIQGISRPFTDGAALPIPDDSRFWYMSNGFENPEQSTTRTGNHPV